MSPKIPLLLRIDQSFSHSLSNKKLELNKISEENFFKTAQKF